MKNHSIIEEMPRFPGPPISADYDPKSICYEDHYKYLDDVIGYFWMEVFGKTLEQTYCSGITGAHGDKCSQYDSRWEAHGINRFHGALLYMLTYTSAMGDYPKHTSCNWVIDNYSKYLPAIVKAEQEVLKQKGSR